MEGSKILLAGGEGEIVEKKSRFIATIRPIACEEEAAAFLAEIRKRTDDSPVIPEEEIRRVVDAAHRTMKGQS